MKFYGYTKFKSQIACNEKQKSEISEELKETIILNLFKWLKKRYKSRFTKNKILLQSVVLNIVPETAT